MVRKKFIPYHKIKKQEVIVVDGLHPNNLTLSHWKGANCITEVAADTSGEIVINAIEKKLKGVDCKRISATHFDIDGFVGVFALFYPELAMEYKNVLIAMAKIGDFREFNPKSEDDIHALKLCCWMNAEERMHFYRPFEEKDEIEKCGLKFDFFLPIFSDVLTKPDNYKTIWQKEFEQVIGGLEKVEKTQQITEIGLMIKQATEPLHYYALFSETDGYDIVLSIYNKQRYELEFKYTTWIDLASRTSFPRVELRQLVKALNRKEKSGFQWVCDKITDTGPILRLEKSRLSKADRYANPYERNIYSSSISKELFEKEIIKFLESFYQDITKKRFWTWKEMKAINCS